MRYGKRWAAAGLCALFLSITPAWADIDEGSFNVTFPNDPNELHHGWSYDYVNEILTLTEDLPVLADDLAVMEAITDEDPVYNIDKTVSNETGITWTAYDLVLETGTGSGYFTGTPSSDKFASYTMSATEINFYNGSVADGGSVKFDFAINVTSIGDFSFTLTQTPIPEPACLSVLGLGGVALLRRRRAG